MITTSPNRVKKGVYWCEDADRIVHDSLLESEYTADSEIPFDWIIEHNTLADTLLSLGAVRPRFQKQADSILLDYVKHLYTCTRTELVGKEIVEKSTQYTPDWIGNPDRAQACRLHHSLWRGLKRSHSEPFAIKLFETMELIFSEQPTVIKATHGTKFYLAAYAIKHGFGESDIVRQNLKSYLKIQLEKTK